MSGQKQTYVSIPEREARRLREQDARLRTVQADLPERLAAIQRSTLEEVNRQSARMDRRWQEFRETTDQLQSDLATLERDSQRRLREGLATARAEFTSLVKQERVARQRQAAQMRQEYTSLIDKERAEREQQIGKLESRITNVERHESKLRNMAEAWLQDLRTLQTAVDKLPHRRFSPGSMEKIDGRISQAEINLRNGASQAALGQAQNAYFDLVELRAEVLYREQEFEAQYLQALAEVRSLIEEVQQNQQGVIQGDEAQAEDIEVNVDFWSKGRLSQLLDRLREIENSLKNDKSTLQLDQVRQMEEEAAGLRRRLPEAVEAARMAIINSQACYNVAEIVADVMEEQGYSVAEGVYEGEDQRSAYAIKMRNLGGDEMVAIVTPSEEQELAYSTEMNFFDRNQDETMRQTFADAVHRGLQQRGLQATQPRETMSVQEQNEEVRDLEKFRQRRPESKRAQTR